MASGVGGVGGARARGYVGKESSARFEPPFEGFDTLFHRGESLSGLALRSRRTLCTMVSYCIEVITGKYLVSHEVPSRGDAGIYANRSNLIVILRFRISCQCVVDTLAFAYI